MSRLSHQTLIIGCCIRIHREQNTRLTNRPGISVKNEIDFSRMGFIKIVMINNDPSKGGLSTEGGAGIKVFSTKSVLD